MTTKLYQYWFTLHNFSFYNLWYLTLYLRRWQIIRLQQKRMPCQTNFLISVLCQLTTFVSFPRFWRFIKSLFSFHLVIFGKYIKRKASFNAFWKLFQWLLRFLPKYHQRCHSNMRFKCQGDSLGLWWPWKL